MPGFEFIGEDEFLQVSEVFNVGGGTLFRHGFDDKRNGVKKVEEFEGVLSKFLEVDSVLALSSGTAALYVAICALNLPPRSKIGVPAFTFIATAEAVIAAGHIPVFIDINKSLTVDIPALSAVIRTLRAVVVVHMLGLPCDMGRLLPLCRGAGIPILEDTAWGFGARVNDAYCGTLGDIGCFSFDHAKLLTTGEGGAIVSKDPELLARCRAIHDHGHLNLPGVPRWKDGRYKYGFNFRMSELQGAVGVAQVKKAPLILSSQARIVTEITRLLHEKGYPIFELVTTDWTSSPSRDAAVLRFNCQKDAESSRRKLNDAGVGTKILPEALKWHFAKEWIDDHIFTGDVVDAQTGDLTTSEMILRRCLALNPTQSILSLLTNIPSYSED